MWCGIHPFWIHPGEGSARWPLPAIPGCQLSSCTCFDRGKELGIFGKGRHICREGATATRGLSSVADALKKEGGRGGSCTTNGTRQPSRTLHKSTNGPSETLDDEQFVPMQTRATVDLRDLARLARPIVSLLRGSPIVLCSQKIQLSFELASRDAWAVFAMPCLA